ncbi:hypothetical protein P256_01825 [Acinetobacter nectaris CIP 110549]|uniref:Uncharacterized protein n=1 Tax=Acinetobacter nectaris CIP 110549 TaxID=1392540 RepID=V2TLS7_9GAMM|nr:hypothetical protein [Acinetobacter nectaris]ESK38292.1 hypothetical protein P256_01825 [Acinetobacter nectaris CIP 110549]
MQYIRTSEGFAALQNRDRALSSKQRQLLLLIGTSDFEKLSSAVKEKLCTSEVLGGLLSLGFIRKNQETTAVVEPIEKPKEVVNTPTLTEETQPAAIKTEPAPSIATPVAKDAEEYDIEFSFDNMKQMMVDALQKHCGLMGKAHIRYINGCTTILELKRSHMTVVTLLQESRMPQPEIRRLTKILQRFYQLSSETA